LMVSSSAVPVNVLLPFVPVMMAMRIPLAHNVFGRLCRD
jgi:hypothetical protein